VAIPEGREKRGLDSVGRLAVAISFGRGQ